MNGVGVGLLQLVEQHDPVRTTPNGLRQLAAVVVAHVPRRRADEAGDGVPLLVLRHVDADHGLLAVEEQLRQGPGQLRLPHTRGAQEEERSDGPSGVLETGTGASQRLRHHRDRMVLAHHPLVQTLLQVEQLLRLRLQETGHRNARLLGDKRGYLLLVDRRLQLLRGEPFISPGGVVVLQGQADRPEAARPPRTRARSLAASSWSWRSWMRRWGLRKFRGHAGHGQAELR